MAVSAAVIDALQVLQQALEQVDPQVPDGVEPWRVDSWVELSQAWVGWNMLAGYFGLQLPELDDEVADAPQPQRTRRGRAHDRQEP